MWWNKWNRFLLISSAFAGVMLFSGGLFAQAEEVVDSDTAMDENSVADTDNDVSRTDTDVSEEEVVGADAELSEAEVEEDLALSEGDGELDMLGASLEELLATPVEVWSASKTEETVETAPSVIDVVTARDISLWGYKTVAEVLQHMVGFYVIDDHILPNAAVRGVSGGLGAESGIIKVMINGRSVAFRSTSGNWLGPELIPLIAVERIEVIRGPASALYGADAFLATVNIVLKKPEDLNGMQALLALGDSVNSSDSNWDVDRRLEIVGGAQHKRFGFTFGMGRTFEDRDGLRIPFSSPTPLIPSYNAGSRDADHLEQRSDVGRIELSYTNEDRGFLRLSGYVSSIERSGEFSQWTQLSDGLDSYGRENQTKIHLQQVQLGLDGELYAGDNLTLDLYLTYFRGGPGDDDRIEVASDLFYVKRHFSFHGFNGVLEANWRPHERLSFIAGMEMLLDHEHLGAHRRIDKSTGEVIGTIDAAMDSKQFLNPAVYLQANATAVPDFLKFTGGLRLDYHNVYGSKITGRAGTVFLWSERFTTKLLYGSAFKAPSPTLLYSTPIMPGDVVGNEDLKPQYVHTFEFAPSLRASKNISIYSAAAYSVILDKAEFVPEGTNITAQNVSKVRTLSLETGVDMAFEDVLASYVSMEFQRASREQPYSDYRNNLVGTENIVAPAWIFRAGLSYSLPFSDVFPFRVGSRLMVVGERRASGDNIVENGDSYLLPVYPMVDAFVASDDLPILPNGKTTIRFTAYNLADVNGPDPGFAGVDYPLLGRRFMLEAVQKF
ncbi:MAG: TonB-dependent receptor [Deltaproteobacteria bacterium]|nr:TonB-dependent receptor [Deltaproteobacteria bacterium]MBN2673754.1 TonB-dependent receptor [Deltaproteobacteria bacterium]